MKIVNLSQREEDWLDWRRQGVTATDAAILLNRSPYKTRW
ncbi:TPA: YqaJ viral recombinase family protein, partial [Escherichia coli]|nr:YqaJ viral recombinase family protein [Escherichia coli]